MKPRKVALKLLEPYEHWHIDDVPLNVHHSFTVLHRDFVYQDWSYRLVAEFLYECNGKEPRP